jgi:hypothetical protein
MATVIRARRTIKSTTRRQTFNETHWRTAYGTREYIVPGMEFADYAPAYRYGVQLSDRHGGKTFAEVEPTLADQWAAVRGPSRLTWQQARPAVREGYAGVVRVIEERPKPARRIQVKKVKTSGSTRVKSIGKVNGRSTSRTRTAARRQDDLNKRGPRDAAKINVNERWEMDYWCRKLGTTPTQLRQAVKKVGTNAKDVRRHLSR